MRYLFGIGTLIAIGYLLLSGFVAPLAITSLFVFGTIFFWLLATIEIIILFVCVSYDEKYIGSATVSLVVFFALLQFLGDIKIFQSIAEKPLLALLYVGGYIVAGIIYSIPKTRSYFKKQGRIYQERKREYLLNHNITGDEIPNHLKRDWQSNVTYSGLYIPGVSPFRNYKGKISAWIAYWPWSFVWTLIDDPIRKLLEAIWFRLQNMYILIANHAFGNVDNDFSRDITERDIT
ncbi:MAG: hypothetical protein HYW78_02400 [Parcubacteria group bacterium]|nr:hypothetical protein [Parcubacteria group bacterium]